MAQKVYLPRSSRTLHKDLFGAHGRRYAGAESPCGAGQVVRETGRVGLNLVTGFELMDHRSDEIRLKHSAST